MGCAISGGFLYLSWRGVSYLPNSLSLPTDLVPSHPNRWTFVFRPPLAARRLLRDPGSGFPIGVSILVTILGGSSQLVSS